MIGFLAFGALLDLGLHFFDFVLKLVALEVDGGGFGDEVFGEGVCLFGDGDAVDELELVLFIGFGLVLLEGGVPREECVMLVPLLEFVVELVGGLHGLEAGVVIELLGSEIFTNLDRLHGVWCGRRAGKRRGCCTSCSCWFCAGGGWACRAFRSGVRWS